MAGPLGKVLFNLRFRKSLHKGLGFKGDTCVRSS